MLNSIFQLIDGFYNCPVVGIVFPNKSMAEVARIQYEKCQKYLIERMIRMTKAELKYLLKENTQITFSTPDSGEFVDFSTYDVREVISELEYEIEQATREKEYLIITKGNASKIHYDQNQFNGYYNGLMIFGGEDGFFSIKIEDIVAITPIEQDSFDKPQKI